MARRASAVNYKWESVGDQDACIRKVCWLGRYLLEHTEHGWETVPSPKRIVKEKLMMVSYVYLWNEEDRVPERIAELPLVEYKQNESFKCLEDWYALNVLADELFTGDADELVSKERKD